jgi:hypothetical protein
MTPQDAQAWQKKDYTTPSHANLPLAGASSPQSINPSLLTPSTAASWSHLFSTHKDSISQWLTTSANRFSGQYAAIKNDISGFVQQMENCGNSADLARLIDGSRLGNTAKVNLKNELVRLNLMTPQDAQAWQKGDYTTPSHANLHSAQPSSPQPSNPISPPAFQRPANWAIPYPINDMQAGMLRNNCFDSSLRTITLTRSVIVGEYGAEPEEITVNVKTWLKPEVGELERHSDNFFSSDAYDFTPLRSDVFFDPDRQEDRNEAWKCGFDLTNPQDYHLLHKHGFIQKKPQGLNRF